MSTISILSPNKRQLLGSKPLFKVLQQIQSGRYQTEVAQLREYSQHHPDISEELRHDLLPWFSIAGHFKRRGPLWDLMDYSQHLLLEITHLSEGEMEPIREQLMANSFVLACFKNVMATGLCFIVATDSTRWQHAQSFYLLCHYFREYLGLERLSEKGAQLEYCCRFSWDPELYLNWEAETFGVFLNNAQSRYK